MREMEAGVREAREDYAGSSGGFRMKHAYFFFDSATGLYDVFISEALVATGQTMAGAYDVLATNAGLYVAGPFIIK